MPQNEVADVSIIAITETKREISIKAFGSAALMRLIEEVRNDESPQGRTAYDRTYHRHNR
ncbi:YhhA family cyclophane-containing RiPP [Mesorhizobium sp. IMUNJ 23033]|uniref:YhhA family cyclophane-containing RiPP n=1 Tax=Mesorhizobium sp. IMUNJ 23033 TaxID=3378039 RepID=UPI00384DF3CD